MGFTPSSIDTQNLDWMVQQNGGSFDPVLFGDYRDPQENIMNGDFGDFFNEALPLPDFGSPITNLTDETKVAKTNVIQEVEDQQSGKEPEVDSGEPSQQFLSCNLLWLVFCFISWRKACANSSTLQGSCTEIRQDHVRRNGHGRFMLST